jgi:hypothetical protein
MRTVNTFGLQFLIRPDKLKEGKVPIYACITVNREIIHLGLKQYIEPPSWDIRRGFGECYGELQLKKLPITAEAIKNTFLRTEEVEHTLSHLFEYHNKTAVHQLYPNTLSHYKTSQKYLRSFPYLSQRPVLLSRSVQLFIFLP